MQLVHPSFRQEREGEEEEGEKGGEREEEGWVSGFGGMEERVQGR